MVISTIALSVHNVLIKFVVEEYSIAEVLFYRNLFASVVFATLMYFMAKEVLNFRKHPPIVHIRSLLSVASWVTGILSIKLLPLNQAVTIYATCSIFATCIAMMIRDEPFNLSRVFVIFVGFFGFAIVALKSYEVHILGIVAATASSLFQAVGIILVRKAKVGIGANIFTINALVFLLVLVGISAPFTSTGKAPDVFDGIILLGVGLFYLATMWFGAAAYRYATVSHVSGLQNLPVIWLTFYDVVAFDIIPTATAIFGATLLVLSSAYLATDFDLLIARKIKRANSSSTRKSTGKIQ
mmetsp:Transcript_24066/g.44407  ORF Transcript_24066/g.44407 Transcript_24066/m.44407 type:complete len:297 (+) Transcript_24066:5993-6883(+)